MFLWLKTRHETVIRRTVLRSQRAKQKPNRWSWGGALQPNTPSIPAGTFIFFFLKIPVLYESYLSLQCKYLFLPFHVSIFLSCLHSIFIFRFPCSLLYLLTHTQLCLSLSLSLPYYYSLTFSLFILALGSPLWSVSLPLSFALVVQVLSSRHSSIHSTLQDWSTCRVLSVSTADTEWPPNVNIMALCLLASQCQTTGSSTTDV